MKDLKPFSFSRHYTRQVSGIYRYINPAEKPIDKCVRVELIALMRRWVDREVGGMP